MGCGPSQLKRHENDLKMVEQLLAKDGATLDAGTTALLIWKCRRDPRLVAAAAAWLEKHSDARRAFDGVEFYLPQLSHMLVHLDVDWPAGTLERFALVVAQQSPHFALQLHWILRAALEDYAPRGDGSGGHERYYRRCAHLAADVESCVAHGSARPENLEELFVAGLIGRDELGARGAAKQASLAQRLVDAALRPMLSVRDGGEPELVDPDVVPHRASTFSGPLSCYVDGSGGACARGGAWAATVATARASRVLDFWGEQFRKSQLHYSPRRSRPQEHDRPSDASAGRWSFGEGPSMWARPSEARHPELSHGAGWKAKEQAARDKSPFAASAPSWRLQAVIVKSNDDLRQEVFVVQLIAHYARAFRSAKLGLFLRPYRIVAVSSTTGLIELVKESTSLDRLYASSGGGLKAHFESTFGPPGSPELSAAVGRFAESLAAASFVCYVLAIKDRHNGNILLDAQGRIVHIDFGFVLGHATGGAFSMERAPFKLTGDFLDVLGDDGLERFASALGDAFVAAAASVDEVTALVEIMQYKSTFPCFRARGAAAVSDFKKRHHAHLGEADLRKKARALVAASANHVGTYVYDVFQHKTNGVSYTK
ncbi:phosphatidylinositol kinase [Aureococcus anophagefferens]|nr:phosphatidylinositol kinase [Aureococcus anophagefferens]